MAYPCLVLMYEARLISLLLVNSQDVVSEKTETVDGFDKI